MYWRYVALLTWPITSMSRNWTGSSMLNFTCDQRADRIRPHHTETRQPISTSTQVHQENLAEGGRDPRSTLEKNQSSIMLSHLGIQCLVVSSVADTVELEVSFLRGFKQNTFDHPWPD
jgi:hypothetical protein